MRIRALTSHRLVRRSWLKEDRQGLKYVHAYPLEEHKYKLNASLKRLVERIYPFLSNSSLRVRRLASARGDRYDLGVLSQWEEALGTLLGREPTQAQVFARGPSRVCAAVQCAVG